MGFCWPDQRHLFCKNLRKTIDAELDAIERYSRLAKLAPNEKARHSILRIRSETMYRVYCLEKMMNRYC